MRARHRQGGGVGGCSSGVVRENHILGSELSDCRRTHTHTFRISAREAFRSLAFKGTSPMYCIPGTWYQVDNNTKAIKRNTSGSFMMHTFLFALLRSVVWSVGTVGVHLLSSLFPFIYQFLLYIPDNKSVICLSSSPRDPQPISPALRHGQRGWVTTRRTLGLMPRRVLAVAC